ATPLGAGRPSAATRWAAADADLFRRYAAELVAPAPDVILASGSPAIMSLQQLTRTVPIVFVNIVDPVGAGFVESLARPGGNATGFVLYEYGMSAKWLELLKEILPALKLAAVLRDPAIGSGAGPDALIQAASPSFGVELRAVGVRDVGEIERAITAFARSSNGGLIVTGSPLTLFHRDLIITLAAPEDVGGSGPLVARRAGAGATLRPAARDFVLLA